MTEVPLDDLKYYRNRHGKWFVYRRSTGEALIKSFRGTRDEVLRQLGTPEFLARYNSGRDKRAAVEFPAATLGWAVHWFTNGDVERDPKDIDPPGKTADGCPDWGKLATATRDDYLKAYRWLRPEFDLKLADITTPDLYRLRDKCTNAKKSRFADKMIRALSAMFKRVTRRGDMDRNPCLGMDQAHEADPDANREWLPKEWTFARDNAPPEVLIPMMIARHIGLRGQTIVGLNRKQIEDDPEGPTGKAVRYSPRKNRKKVREVFLPVMEEMQTFLAELTVQRADGVLAVRDDGSLWPSEKEMQTRVSHWLRDQERAGKIGNGTTLHGLRVSYAAWWKRMGATDAEVAALIGDVSQKMGVHYTRHVEAEAKIRTAFERVKGKT